MPFTPVTSAPSTWAPPAYLATRSSVPDDEPTRSGTEEPTHCITTTASVADDHLGQVFDASADVTGRAPLFNERVRQWLFSMLPPSHEAAAHPLRSSLLAQDLGSEATSARAPSLTITPFVDPKQVDATRSMRKRKQANAERRARALGFLNVDGSGDVQTMRRTRLHRTCIAQGFVKADGTADPQAYTRDLKVREFQRGIAIRAEGKPLSEYWNYTLERFSRLAGFFDAAGVGDIDAYAQHLAALPPRAVPSKGAETAICAPGARPGLKQNISESTRFGRPRLDKGRSQLNDSFRERNFRKASRANTLSRAARDLSLATPLQMTSVVKARLVAAEESARLMGFKNRDGSGNIAQYQLDHVEKLVSAGAFSNPDGTVNRLERDKYLVQMTALNEGFLKPDQTHDSRSYCAYKLEQYSRRAGFEIRGAGDVTTYLNALRHQAQAHGESLEAGLAFMWERVFHASGPI